MKPYREVANKNAELQEEIANLKHEIAELRTIANRLIVHLEDEAGRDHWVVREVKTALNKKYKKE